MERFITAAKSRSEAAAESVRAKLGIDDVDAFTEFLSTRPIAINFRTGFFTEVGESTQYLPVSNELRSKKRAEVEQKLFDIGRGEPGLIYGTYDVHGQLGVDGALFGACYFVLKDHIRNHITLTHRDTFYIDLDGYIVGVPQHMLHIVDQLDDIELNAIHQISAGKIASTHKYRCYVEAQLHTPLFFDSDVERICVPNKVATGGGYVVGLADTPGTEFMDHAARFAEMHGIPLEIVPDRRNVCM